MASEVKEEELSCPICMVTEEDNEESVESIIFVRTPCGHVFRKECIEQVLLKVNPVQDGSFMPCKGKCPISRLDLDLFDLTNAKTGELMFTNDSISTWQIANCVYKQRMLATNSSQWSQSSIEDKGAIKGYGFVFSFDAVNKEPRLNFQKPLQSISKRGVYSDEYLQNASRMNVSCVHRDDPDFEQELYHEKSRTYRALINFSDPIYEQGFLFKQLELTVQFDQAARYIRKGLLLWNAVPTSVDEYPLDGVWKFRWPSSGTVDNIIVYRHSFNYHGKAYRIELDDERRPRFEWPDDQPQNRLTGPTVQKSTQKFIPGNYEAKVGEEITWKICGMLFHETIVWTRLASHQDIKLDVPIAVGSTLYQQVDGDVVVGPSYHGNQLWGNVFCQVLLVGLASYHFKTERDENGDYQAYISYESPQTSVWPPLENGQHVSEIGQVPFRDIEWNEDARTFKGKICWEQDYGTTWNNEAEWRYTIVFDETFSFVHSGTVKSDTRPPHQFGQHLVYINAGLESKLQKLKRQADRSREEYMNTLREWRESGASYRTQEMLNRVAMAVLDGTALIDFNL